MKKLPALAILAISACSCQENLIMPDADSSSHDDIPIVNDSLMIYTRQSSQGEILKNLIRFENNRFFLDLTSAEASELGISSSAYENAQTQIEQLNNTNLKLK